MRAMVWRSSAGIGKTVHLAVDWDHGESPPHGRLAVCLVSEAAREALLPSDVNIRKNRKNGKPEGAEPEKGPGRGNARLRAFHGGRDERTWQTGVRSRRSACDANDLADQSPNGETVVRERGRQRRKMVGSLWDVRRDRADARVVPVSTTGENQFGGKTIWILKRNPLHNEKQRIFGVVQDACLLTGQL